LQPLRWHMPTPHPEVVTAARTLLEWARTRQTVWRDPSTDLIAALGNRYQSFVGEEVRHERPPVPELKPVPVTAVTPPVVAAPPMPRAEIKPVTAVTPVNPLIPPEPVIASRPSIIPPRKSVAKPVWTSLPSETMRTEPVASPRYQAPQTPKSGWMMKTLAAGAVLVVAGVAAPAVWRRYQPTPVATALTTPRGMVSLESTPPNSTVVVDGVERGSTPVTLELAAGVHSVEFRYRSNVRTVDVTIAAGERTTSSVDWTRRARPRPPTRTEKAAPAKSEATENPEPDPPAAQPGGPTVAEPVELPDQPPGVEPR
jgi:hypothetical protein